MAIGSVGKCAWVVGATGKWMRFSREVHSKSSGKRRGTATIPSTPMKCGPRGPPSKKSGSGRTLLCARAVQIGGKVHFTPARTSTRVVPSRVARSFPASIPKPGNPRGTRSSADERFSLETRVWRELFSACLPVDFRGSAAFYSAKP